MVFADDDGVLFDDNQDRMIFFCKGAIETVKNLVGHLISFIVMDGWLVWFFYLKTTYKNDPVFKHSKVVFSVYDQDIEKVLRKSS